MKKIFLVLLVAITIIIIIIVVNINSNNIELSNTLEYNKQFEEYKDKKIYGADVLTIINKAIDNNSKYNIEKDGEGYYIDDNNKTVKVELILLTQNKDKEIIEVRYPMETLHSLVR